MSLTPKQDRFIFRKDDKIGLNDASSDKNTLLANFINTGDYDRIAKMGSPERFILGRTGAGKTALFTRLSDEKEHVIAIKPEGLSLDYISSSTIIQALTSLGVDFDLFYRMLWKHVLCVEMLRYHYRIKNRTDQDQVIRELRNKFKNSPARDNHYQAIDYLEKYGDSFWQETDYRVKEIVSGFVDSIEGSVGVNTMHLMAGINSKSKLTEQQTAEIKENAKKIVSSVQMKALADLTKLIDDVMDDRQKYYYIVIDELDEDWVENSIRYKLIRALIETVKEFVKLDTIKVMVILRNDLLEKVFDETKDRGFQKEKYTDHNLNIFWNKDQLIEMLNRRINYLVKSRYTGEAIDYTHIMPPDIDGEEMGDYIINRTLMRPRDVIAFFNFCIEQADTSATMTINMIKSAEKEYSLDRRAAIRAEWESEYMKLNEYDKVLRGIKDEFLFETINDDKIFDIAYKLISHEDLRLEDRIINKSIELVEELITLNSFKQELLYAFYIIGYIGVYSQERGRYLWSNQPNSQVQIDDLSEETVFKVHPCFHTCFAVKKIGDPITEALF